jgi:hypothetical protein
MKKKAIDLESVVIRKRKEMSLVESSIHEQFINK